MTDLASLSQVAGRADTRTLLQKLAETWPAKMAQAIYGGLTLPGDVYAGRVEPGGLEAIGRASDLAGTIMGGAAPLASNVSRAGEFALGIVPVDAARRMNVAQNLPTSDTFTAAVRNTPGAAIDNGALTMSVSRRQMPEQELEESVRGGVFYLPKGSKDQKFYSGTKENFAYGGQQKIEGETAYLNPLFVKGATGGKAPEAAYDQLLGKGAYQEMRKDALHWGFGPKDIKVEAVTKFLEKYAPELADNAYHIVQNSTKGNQLAYALQEAAVGSAARKAGHDAVLGYSVGRKTKEPFLSEVFDVRENVYPSPRGDYGVWPQFEGKP